MDTSITRLNKLDITGHILDEFQANAMLTHSQLNRIVGYNEDAHRLSRILGAGVGIVCGLQYKVMSDAKGKHIEITPGYGMTTDGDTFINEKVKEFRTCRELNPNLGKRYPRLQGDAKQVFELLEEGGAASSGGQLSEELPLSSPDFNLNDYILVAYLDNYIEDPGICGSTDCIDIGKKIHLDPYYLLVKRDHWKTNLMGDDPYDSLIEHDPLKVYDTIFHEHNVWSFYDLLPDLSIHRAVLKYSRSSSLNVNWVYYSVFNINVISNLSNKLKDVYKKIIDRFDSRIDVKRLGITKVQIDLAFGKIFDSITNTYDIQYRYDLVKDFIDTYNEMRSLILHLNVDCIANFDSFPKHLSLGSLNNSSNTEEFRHRFYHAGTNESKKQNLMRFRSLILRFWKQLKTYPSNPNQSLFDKDIRITPSLTHDYPLGKRAIPYYSKASEMIKCWDYDKKTNRSESFQMGYDRNAFTSDLHISYPNQYTHLDKRFYRIEGHIGASYEKALIAIDKKKRDDGLAFDVKAVSVGLNVQNIDWSKYQCYFSDLEVMLDSWQLAFNCLSESVLEFFGNFAIDGSGYQGEKARKEVVEKRASDERMAAEFKPLTRKRVFKEEIRKENIYKSCNEKNAKIRDISRNAEVETEATIGLPASMIMYVYKFQTFKWNTFINDHGKLDQLAKQIKEFCDDRKQAAEIFNEYLKDVANEGKSFYLDKVVHLLNSMQEICCYRNKLLWLKEEVERRKKKILADLSLGKFIEKHSGAEHMAGVSAGGTFVLLYEADTSKIIADFALPYLCCSDCAPSQVVIHAPEAEAPEIPNVDLSMEIVEFCKKDDTLHAIVLTPTETDTEVTGEGVSLKNGHYVFNPSLVDIPSSQGSREILLNVEIDGKVVNSLRVKVYRQPQAEFEIVREGDLWKIKDLSSEFYTGKIWMINEEQIEFSETLAILTQNYQKGILSNVILRVKNGACEAKTSDTLPAPVIEPEERATDLSIERSQFCSDNSEEQTITVFPSGAQGAVSGEGVSMRASGIYIFNANEVEFSTGEASKIVDLTLKVNEVEVQTITVSVFKKPTAAFTFEGMDRNWIVVDNSTDAESKTWVLNGESIEFKNIPKRLTQNYNEGIASELTLKITNGPCEASSSDTLSPIEKDLCSIGDWYSTSLEIINSMNEDRAGKIFQLKDLYAKILVSSQSIYDERDNLNERHVIQINEFLDKWRVASWGEIEAFDTTKYMRFHEIMILNYVIIQSTVGDDMIENSQLSIDYLLNKKRYYNQKMNPYFSGEFRDMVKCLQNVALQKNGSLRLDSFSIMINQEAGR